MREKEIEQQLVKAVKKAKGICLKLMCPGLTGMPDRLVLLPKSHMAFVELKAPGKKPRLLQIKRMKQLTELGFSCYVVDSKEMIDKVVDEIGGDAL